MLKADFAAIRRAFSGEAAKEDVASIIRYHRIQASPGYRQAAQYVLQQLQQAGVPAHIETYPANYRTKFWNASSFQEWEATSATLHLVRPADQATRLADYRELKLSLIQRSTAFQGEVELVLLEDGLQPADYQDLDVAGKMVLSNGPVEQVRQLAVEQYGAIGILFDGMNQAPPVRQEMDLPDARQYTSFWWTGLPQETQCFGFVLSPRQGRWLRKCIKQQISDGQPPVKLRVDIDARFCDGEIELVIAAIPGQEQGRQSVLIVSHLCHPQPSANDNATGVAANLEAARTLQRLISQGRLSTPRRTIRFLWMPEMTGSYAYLQRHEAEIAQMVAGINLDMVGEDQSQTGSVLLLERPPDAAASFAPELLERLREELYDDAQTHTGMGGYPLYRYATTNFSGGSDHYIFSDPTVGVPMPMLIQWPDKFYHTSADTLDKVDPASLARSGSLAAAYAYIIAKAGQSETRWLAQEMLARFQVRLTQAAQAHITARWPEASVADQHRLEQRLVYQTERFQVALQTLARLWPGITQEIAPISQQALLSLQQAQDRTRLLTASQAASDDTPPGSESTLPEELARRIPHRLYRGPGLAIGALASLPAAERAAWRKLIHGRQAAYTLPVLAEYWADGRRTIAEIVQLIELETGIHDPELVAGQFELLHQLGLITYVHPEKEVAP